MLTAPAKTLFAGAALALSLLPTALLADTDRTAIHDRAENAQPLMAGMMAPAFEVRTAQDAPFRFDPSTMEKPVVLTFFRGGWCPYCNLHLSELRKAEEELKALGFDVWFMSIDKPSLLVESLDDPEIGYTLYSDAQISATRAFGLAFRLGDDTVERYRGFGVDVEAVSGENHHVLPVPATFIIGQDGMINFAYANPSYDIRLHPEVLLAAARAYREDADKRLQRR